MKIMFYINAIHHGGAERVMVNLAGGFASAGHDVSLVTSYRDTWEYPLSQSVRRLNLCDALPGGFLKRNLVLAKRLRKAVKSERPDVLVSFMAEPNFRALIATVGLKTKNLISVRNDPNREYPTKLFKILAKNLYKRADGVVFQTSDAKAWFPKKIQDKSRIIMNQVDERFYNTERSEATADIITTGRLTKQKNQKMLIRAYAKIADRISDNLVIYGDGELLPELEALVSELKLEGRVRLPGATKDVAGVLSTAKVFVLSSDFEGMPNSLMEALAVGVPSISTDCPCGGPREIIKDGENGLLCPVGDDNALSAAILRLAVDKDTAENIAACAKERAKAFAPEIVIAKWLDYVENL